jgi:2-acylglycerol O-acyltransferase 2
MKIFSIEFVPLLVPFKRRLQTLSVCVLLFTFLHFLTVVAAFLLVYLLFTKLYWLTLLYLIYYYYDFDRCEKGGFQVKFARRAGIWKYFRDYFPINLVKTSKLDPSKNYILGVHPHGIMSFGTIANFGTEANDFSKKFPGITPHLMTLRANFCWPLTREYNLLYGCCVASKKSFQWILNNRGDCKKRGQACVLVVGGAQESLDVQPGKYVLTILKRKGFIKMALTTGANLVPVFSFGENDVYSTYSYEKGTKLRFIQEKFKQLTSFTLPLIMGRGIFNYSFGLLPRRRQITTVVGRPIEVTRVEKPSIKDIDKLHKKYVVELVKLFNDNKKLHKCDENSTLVLV